MLHRAIDGAPPTILQVLPRLQTGGVERGTIEMAQAITEAGWRAVVASEGGRMVRDLERLGAVHVTLPLASKNPLRIRRNVEALSKVIGDHNVSLVHARSRAPAWSALKAAQACGVPFVTTFHGTYNLGPFELKKRYNAVMAMGERVIAISQFIRRHILSNYQATTPIDDSRIRVIHRGVDFAKFDPDKVSAERMIALSTRWRLSDDEPVILLPGRLTRWKGQLLLIDALQKLKDLRFRCVLVGSDQGRAGYRAEIEAAIDSAGLRDRVQVADDCHDMPAAYMLADVVVSASTDPEAFGRVAAEAQAMGRPVIAPDHGAAPEIVQHHQTGWLFAAMHPGSLATMLREALTMGAQARAVYAAKAMAHARASFSKDQMCSKTLAVYQELLTK
jgi:glycosyltransferase involved in cell wall biosynthesis